MKKIATLILALVSINCFASSYLVKQSNYFSNQIFSNPQIQVLNKYDQIGYIKVELDDERLLEGLEYERDQKVWLVTSPRMGWPWDFGWPWDWYRCPYCRWPQPTPEPAPTPEPNKWAKQWGMDKSEKFGVNADKAWELSRGNEVIIAVLDTGVDTNHPDLAKNIWKNQKEIAGNGVDDDSNGFIDDINGYDFANKHGFVTDDNGHGTHCAGVVGANGEVKGLALNARIMALKFLASNGSGDVSDAVEGVLYAVDNGAKVISASFGGGYSEALKEAIKYAESRDVLFVAAAGNDSRNIDFYPTYPASYNVDNVITVEAHDRTGQRSYFSNYGNSVDVSAPGSAIYSTYLFNSYKELDGTSMATPFVSAASALVWAYRPDYSYLQVKEALKENIKLDAYKSLTSSK